MAVGSGPKIQIISAPLLVLAPANVDGEGEGKAGNMQIAMSPINCAKRDREIPKRQTAIVPSSFPLS